MILKNIMIVFVVLVVILMIVSVVFVVGQCLVYLKVKIEKVEFVDFEKIFGVVLKFVKELCFVYVIKIFINEFWQDVVVGVKDEVGKYNIKVDVQFVKDEFLMIEQFNLVQMMLLQKLDVLFFLLQLDFNFVLVIKVVWEVNILIIIIDDVCIDGVSSYIGIDQVVIGGKVVDYLGECFKDGGKVVQIEGVVGFLNVCVCIKGFQEGLKKYFKFQFVVLQLGNWDCFVVLNVMSNILCQNLDFVGVYVNNDGMVFGVVEVVCKGSLLVKVVVVGMDGICEVKKLVGVKEMVVMVVEFFFEEGQFGVQVVLCLIGCQEVLVWVVLLQVVIMSDNVVKFFDLVVLK